MPEQVLEARGLSKQYRRGTWALKEIDLSVSERGVVGLVGPNGAGKSTLLKTWIGFERPTTGLVSVFGLDPWRERSRVLPRVAYLAQTPSLYRDLRVIDHLDFVAHYREKQFDRALASKRLSDLRVPLRSTVGKLSGGQTAQVGLAIALGLRTDVLLLDEPLASLDPLARREFIEVLRDDLAQSGATAILSSHVVTDIEQACRHLIILGVGRVQLNAEVTDILAQHAVSLEDPSDPSALIAKLPGGARLCRIESSAGRADVVSKPATLDDVVLGYLTAARAEG
jgi:ABC-2 type transport system ATP-binding protein